MCVCVQGVWERLSRLVSEAMPSLNGREVCTVAWAFSQPTTGTHGALFAALAKSAYAFVRVVWWK